MALGLHYFLNQDRFVDLGATHRSMISPQYFIHHYLDISAYPAQQIINLPNGDKILSPINFFKVDISSLKYVNIFSYFSSTPFHYFFTIQYPLVSEPNFKHLHLQNQIFSSNPVYLLNGGRIEQISKRSVWGGS